MNIVITGASTGIGAVTALHLDQLGARVFACVRKQSDADALIARASSRLQIIFLDVTDEAMTTTALQQIQSSVGDEGLHGLINNAGIAVGGPLELIPAHQLKKQFEVNVFGAVKVTQTFLPLLRRGKGRIINISSISGKIVFPFFGAYAASKFALEAVTDGFRRELKPFGIAVISIEPGSVKTPIWQKSLSDAQVIVDINHPSYSLYEEKILAVKKIVDGLILEAIEPEEVSNVILKALTSTFPRTRYQVGRGAKIGAIVARLFPDWLLDKWIKV